MFSINWSQLVLPVTATYVVYCTIVVVQALVLRPLLEWVHNIAKDFAGYRATARTERKITSSVD